MKQRLGRLFFLSGSSPFFNKIDFEQDLFNYNLPSTNPVMKFILVVQPAINMQIRNIAVEFAKLSSSSIKNIRNVKALKTGLLPNLKSTNKFANNLIGAIDKNGFGEKQLIALLHCNSWMILSFFIIFIKNVLII